MINEIDDTFVIDGPLSTVGEVVARLEEENNYNLIFADIRLGSDLVFDALPNRHAQLFRGVHHGL